MLVVAGVVVGLGKRASPEIAPHPAGGKAPQVTAAVAAATPGERRPRGITDSEIVFGMASPFSGGTKELGRGMKAGVELAFAAANDAGGVHGRQLKLVALDDGYEPSRTLGVMKELVEQRGVFAVVGNVGSVTAAVSVPYALEKRIPFVGALSGAGVLRRDPPDRYVFNFRPSYTEETSAAVRYLVNVRRYKPSQIAVFAQDDDFGQAGWNGVAQQMRKLGRDPESVLRLSYKRNTADVDGAVAKLREAGGQVKAVVMVATFRGAARFIQRVRDSGLSVTFTNVSPVDATALADELVQAGAKYTEDVIVTQIVPSPQSRATAVMRYRDALEKHALGERPGYVSLEGYVVGSIVVDALKRAGRDVDTESFVSTLEGIQGLDLGMGAPITFGPSEHQGSHKVWGTMLEPAGTYRPIELE
jgi:ABC-type branched-subunit amino acid transport system substrate-binding protein